MASALFKLSSDGGSTYADPGVALADDEALTYNASGTYSIKAALDSTAGVGTASWSITSADDVNIASLPTVTQNASDKTCTFSVTKTGGAWLLQCIVNGGINLATGKADPALTRSLAIKVLNSAGQQEIAVGESTEAGAYGWTKAINDALRVAGGGGGGVIAGAGLTLTGSTLDVGAADSTIQVNANSIQALPANIVTASTVTTALGALSASVSVNSQKITTLADPTSAQDAATKNYVDGLLTTLDLKASVRVATESTLLSLSGEQTIDGVSAVAGDRVLVKDQEILSTNGIYVVAAGSWSRATDADSSAEVTSGMFCFVEEGTVNGGTGWLLTTANPITLGSTALAFEKFTNTALDEPGFRALASALTADLDVNNKKIVNLATPTSSTDAATKAYVDSVAGGSFTEADLRTASAALTATMSVNGQVISDVGVPSSPDDAASKDYVDNAAANEANLRFAASNLTASLDVNSKKITSLAVPTSDQDAVPRMHVNGYNDVSVAGSGSVSLSTADTDWFLVDLIGTLSGDRTVSLPNAQRSLLVRNSTTGTYTLRLTGSAGGFTYLAPGQTRRVYTNGTTLIGEALRVVEYETSLDLSSGYTVGNHDVALFKVPAAFDVDRVEIRCTTGISGGTITLSAGVSGSYNQLIDAQTGIASAGDVAGLDTTFAGADFTDRLAAHYSSAQTLTLRIAVATGTLTAGALRVMVVGRYVGE